MIGTIQPTWRAFAGSMTALAWRTTASSARATSVPVGHGSVLGHPLSATPGENVQCQVRLAASAQPPFFYQWRRETFHYETNVVRFENPDDPRGIYWRTNVTMVFTATDLADQTNAVLSLVNVQTKDSGLYSVAISNFMGRAVSPPAPLQVDVAFAGISTNEYWSQVLCANNLRMLQLLLSLWAADHHGQLPSSFGVLTNFDGSWEFGWPTALFCRSDTARTAPADWGEADFSNTSYELISGGGESPDAPLCRCRFHGFYLTRDAQVVWRPHFVAIRRQGTGQVELTYRVFAGSTSPLESSTDLAHWNVLTNHGSINAEFRLTDSSSTAMRFYRIRAND